MLARPEVVVHGVYVGFCHVVEALETQEQNQTWSFHKESLLLEEMSVV